MSYEERTKTVAKPHDLTMEDRKKLSVSGVEEVESFDDTEIVMTTSGGSLIVRGSGLNISKLDLDRGEVSVQGLISDLSYQEVAPSGSLWARLFH
ncbi:MAG: sporulation protein YabP [Oscillospiraceae bacterium]